MRELAILGQVRVQVLLPGKQDALISPRFHRRRTRGALRTYPPRFGRCLRRRRRRHPAGSQRRRTAPVARVGESRFRWRCVPMREGRGVYIHVTATRPGRATPAPELVSLRSCPPAAPPRRCRKRMARRAALLTRYCTFRPMTRILWISPSHKCRTPYCRPPALCQAPQHR